jgi:ribonuclease R
MKRKTPNRSKDAATKSRSHKPAGPYSAPSGNRTAKKSSEKARDARAAQPAAAAKPSVAPLQTADIVAALRDAGQPLTFELLAQRVNFTSAKSKRALTPLLEEAIRSGDIIRNRREEYCLRDRLGLLVGTVSGHRDGHGFVHMEDRAQPPVLLSHRQMQQTMHGDRVAVRITGQDRRGRPEGTLVEVIERGTTEIVGRLYDEEGACFVIPDNPRIGHRVLVPRTQLNGAKAGQIVLLKLVEQPSRIAQPLGHVSRIVGDHAAPGMETDIAIHSHGLPFEFPEGAVQEAAKFGDAVRATAKRDREDLRELPLVTIDGEDARDFDDAVYCEPQKDGWRLLVAIADVGSYVESGTALDIEALNRATSVYFPNRVLPMLPEALSNGLCSLNPDVDRLCMVCEMRINAEGKVTRARFFEGLMRSVARLTYTEVAGYLAQANKTEEQRYPLAAKVGPQLQALHALFRALHAARVRRGALDFDAPELKVRFDSDGKIAALVEQSRNDAHRLIEECMIAANVEAAKFLNKHRIPTLYRVHGSPEEDRLEQLREFLRGFAIELPRDRQLTPDDFGAILRGVAGNDEARLIETVVVRSMPQAVYQPQSIGHFGLALQHYAHFTSPIRRYPDLIVHRGIRHVLRGGTAQDLPAELLNMEALGQQCSLKERRADEATRDAMSWLKCRYMQDKIGEEFDALVTGVVDFGLFVQVSGIQIDGLLHVSALGSDYFSRDASGYRLIGARSKRVYKLGDRLRVRLINVIIDERKIDFELAQAAANPHEHAQVRGPWGRRGRDRQRT